MEQQLTQRVGIVHGVGGSSATHWQTWLARKCRSLGMETVYPKLPGRNHPELPAWLEALSRSMPLIDKTTALVGHSMGCPAILRLLIGNKADSAGLVVLVAPSSLSRVFGSELGFMLPFFDTLMSPNLYPLRSRIAEAHVFASDNDRWVNPDEAMQIAVALDARFHYVRGAGHMDPAAGYHTFPEVLAIIAGRPGG